MSLGSSSFEGDCTGASDERMAKGISHHLQLCNNEADELSRMHSSSSGASSCRKRKAAELPAREDLREKKLRTAQR